MFNGHKLKRKYKRRKRVKHKSMNVLYGSGSKDFAWRGRKSNPLTNISPKVFSGRMKLYVAILVLSGISVLGIFLYHPFFHISEIDIQGIERLSQNEIREAIDGTLAHKKFFVLPAKSYFFVGISEMSVILSERFPLENVQITKEFPNKLTVILEERLSTVIYDDGETYYFVGLTGRIVEPIRKVTDAEWKVEFEVVTSTNELGEAVEEKREVSRYHIPDVQGIRQDVGDYPIIFTERKEDASIATTNDEVVQEQYIRAIIEWYNHLKSEPTMQPRYTNIQSPYDTIFYTSGPQLHITLLGESAPQMLRLDAIRQEVKDISSLQYIDARFAGKVYWK